ncbi:hypothetical protein D3C79_36030 [compost metagenome]
MPGTSLFQARESVSKIADSGFHQQADTLQRVLREFERLSYDYACLAFKEEHGKDVASTVMRVQRWFDPSQHDGFAALRHPTRHLTNALRDAQPLSVEHPDLAEIMCHAINVHQSLIAAYSKIMINSGHCHDDGAIERFLDGLILPDSSLEESCCEDVLLKAAPALYIATVQLLALVRDIPAVNTPERATLLRQAEAAIKLAEPTL